MIKAHEGHCISKNLSTLLLIDIHDKHFRKLFFNYGKTGTREGVVEKKTQNDYFISINLNG